jgi:hypothetical protein
MRRFLEDQMLVFEETGPVVQSWVAQLLRRGCWVPLRVSRRDLSWWDLRRLLRMGSPKKNWTASHQTTPLPY